MVACRAARWKRPQPLKAGASWQSGSKYNSALSALLHRVEPNASWSLCPPFWVHLRQRFAPLGRAQPAQRRTLGLIPSFSPFLGDCLGAPNSRWRWGPYLLQHVVELAVDVVEAAKHQQEAIGGGYGSPYLIRNASMRPQPPLLAGASVRRPYAPVWESGRRRYLSHVLGPIIR